MSAYLVEYEHINYLVGAMLCPATVRLMPFSYWSPTQKRCVEVRSEDASAVGQMLWEENAKSVSYRYKEAKKTLGPYHRRRHYRAFDPIQLYKACECLGYQSCEHPEWDTSDAKACLDALRSCAIHSHEDYDKANWGPPEPEEKTA